MLSLLAQHWRTERLTPAPGLGGFWHADETATFDLTRLAVSPSQGPFYLDAGPPACLRPLVLREQPGSTAFYLEVLAATSQELRLALWAQYPHETTYRHCFTYDLVPDVWA